MTCNIIDSESQLLVWLVSQYKTSTTGEIPKRSSINLDGGFKVTKPMLRRLERKGYLKLNHHSEIAVLCEPAFGEWSRARGVGV